MTGVDEREASSPSFFNVAEVEVLMSYVRKLLESSGKKGHGTIAPHEIGIIAPYRKQVGLRHARPKYEFRFFSCVDCRSSFLMAASQVQKIRKAIDKVAKEFKFKDMNGLKVTILFTVQGCNKSSCVV